MHIPDGFLSAAVTGGTWVAVVAAVSYTANKGQHEVREKGVPLIGVVGAFVFAAQMLNFPVAAGTSGHLLGGAIAAILLGPWLGVSVLQVVVLVQALLFQDGGILALGANTLNMAVIGVLTAWITYRAGRALLGSGRIGVAVSAAAAAWVSVVVASLAAGVELALSGAYAAGVVIPAMCGVHMLIGIGEALITVAVVAFVASAGIDLPATDRARA